MKYEKIYKGVSMEKSAFFRTLTKDHDFTSELGKLILSAGELETEIKLFLKNKNIEYRSKAPLGELINNLNNSDIFDIVPGLKTHLNELRDQRNFLTHNVNAFLNDLVDSAIVVKEELQESDISVFTERAFILKENLKDLADLLLELRNKK